MANSLSKLVCALFVFSMVLVVLDAPVALGTNSVHDPIVIRGNHDFTSANGVTSGSGTATDPFIIEGWQITAGPADGVKVSYTDSYFIIRDLTIQGTNPGLPNGGFGILLEHVSNAVIESVNVSGCWAGIELVMSKDVIISGCDVHDCPHGIHIANSYRVTMTSNRVFHNWWSGIGIYSSTYCKVSGNEFVNNSAGLVIFESTKISVFANDFAHDGITLTGKNLGQLDSHFITNDNLVGGLPVYYYVGAKSLLLSDMAVGEVILVNCASVAVENMTLSNSSVGIEVAFCQDVLISSCHLQRDHAGVLMMNSHDVDVAKCDFAGNDVGVNFWSSDSIDLYENQYTDNGCGVAMYECVVVYVAASTFTGNYAGISTESCDIVILVGNRIESSEQFGIHIAYCTKTAVAGNYICNSSYYGYARGVEIWGGKKVLIEDNNFIGNDIQAKVFEQGDVRWDNGGTGNYWSDYTGEDLNGDGIGDTPYVIDSNNQDNFPFTYVLPIQI